MTAKEFAKTFELPANITQSDGDYLFAEAYADARDRHLRAHLQWYRANFCDHHQMICTMSSGPCGLCEWKKTETSLARVRGLLQRLIEDDQHCHWCWECEAGADVDGGARLIHKTDCELGKFLGAESADIGKLDTAKCMQCGWPLPCAVHRHETAPGVEMGKVNRVEEKVEGK